MSAEDKLLTDCFDHYMSITGHPPSVFEIWAWMDAAKTVALDHDIEGTFRVD